MTILLKPIAEELELYYVICRNIITFILHISVIIADMAEADKFANVYQLLSAEKLCEKCIVSKDDLNNLGLTHISSRTPDMMRQAIHSGNDHYYSIHPENNAF